MQMAFPVLSSAEHPLAYFATALALLVTFVYAVRKRRNYIDLPELKTGLDGYSQTREICELALKKFPIEPCKTQSDMGEVIIIPPGMLNDVKNLPEFPMNIDYVDHVYLPGFEVFTQNEKMNAVITRHLTKGLGNPKLTADLSDEATLGLKHYFTDSTEWHQVPLGMTILAFISRLSGRIFMGPDLCRSTWPTIAMRYAALGFQQIYNLRRYHPLLRYVVHWFIPECRQMRALIREADAFMEPFVQQRREARAAALAKGEAPPVYDDAIEWTENECGKQASSAVQQLALNAVAVHTTTDLLQQVLMQLILHPEYLEPMRKEVIGVLKSRGMSKQALHDMKLMDAFVKEASRIKPAQSAQIMRMATRDITLPNGFVVKKGQMCWITAAHHWDPQYHTDPEKFDPNRWLSLRGTDREHQSALVSTSVDHIGFGHGRHACPGRFFASHEIKLTMCHLLLKYEWRLPLDLEGKAPPLSMGYSLALISNPALRLDFRRREPEIDIDALKAS